MPEKRPQSGKKSVGIQLLFRRGVVGIDSDRGNSQSCSVVGGNSVEMNMTALVITKCPEI